MRAKRSKKYRKIMSTYSLHFSFRTPYQVLCDSNFLRQCHSFHMPVQKSLENTLHGDARPYITQCSLAQAKAENEGRGRGDGKPVWLPPPTEVPLRYCKHKDSEGNELGVVGEVECLVDLIAGQPKGNEMRKNKNHYVLATAESAQDEQISKERKQGQFQNQTPRKRKQSVDVREAVRQIPGTPIVYVKRSVMVLEELSGASERQIRGIEKDKFKDGLISNVRGTKRKREDEEEDGSENNDAQQQLAPKVRSSKKVKQPNPLSVMKKKVKPTPADHTTAKQNAGNETRPEGHKKSRKRKHGKKDDGSTSLVPAVEAGPEITPMH